MPVHACVPFALRKGLVMFESMLLECESMPSSKKCLFRKCHLIVASMLLVHTSVPFLKDMLLVTAVSCIMHTACAGVRAFFRMSFCQSSVMIVICDVNV